MQIKDNFIYSKNSKHWKMAENYYDFIIYYSILYYITKYTARNLSPMTSQ